MGYDPYEDEMQAAKEAYEEEVVERFLEELGPELSDEAVEKFKLERLRHYYLTHPALAKSAFDSLERAKLLRQHSVEAALAFAVASIEITLKIVFLKPVVFGLVHTENFAELISELIVKHTGLDRFRELLQKILKEYGGVDLTTHSAGTPPKPLWNQITRVQEVRNQVLHKGHAGTDHDADLAIEVAYILLDQIFGRVLASLKLHLHEHGVLSNLSDRDSSL